MIKNIEEIREFIQSNTPSLIFVKTSNCGVCDVMLKKVNQLLEQYPSIKKLLVSIEEVPEFAGQYLVFTAPTILVFNEGQEVLRESRFVELNRIERVLSTLTGL